MYMYLPAAEATEVLNDPMLEDIARSTFDAHLRGSSVCVCVCARGVRSHMIWCHV